MSRTIRTATRWDSSSRATGRRGSPAVGSGLHLAQDLAGRAGRRHRVRRELAGEGALHRDPEVGQHRLERGGGGGPQSLDRAQPQRRLGELAVPAVGLEHVGAEPDHGAAQRHVVEALGPQRRVGHLEPVLGEQAAQLLRGKGERREREVERQPLDQGPEVGLVSQRLGHAVVGHQPGSGDVLGQPRLRGEVGLRVENRDGVAAGAVDGRRIAGDQPPAALELCVGQPDVPGATSG